MIAVELVRRPIDVSRLLAAAEDPSCGAVALFTGVVRDRNEGRAVSGIEYRAYESMAAGELGRIAEEAAARHRVRVILIEHRLGPLTVGDVSVAIVTAHAHRAPALRALEQVIEELKARVPIWKRELYLDGTREWVDPTRAPTAGTGPRTLAEREP